METMETIPDVTLKQLSVYGIVSKKIYNVIIRLAI